jgi:S1-C subfamily serine protease
MRPRPFAWISPLAHYEEPTMNTFDSIGKPQHHSRREGRWFRVAPGALLPCLLAIAEGAAALTSQEAILRAKPAAVMIVSRIGADISMECGQGRITVSPEPLVETASGWFVDGRGYIVTNAHVVVPPSAAAELTRAAIQEGCVEPELRARRLATGQRPDVEERLRLHATERVTPTVKLVMRPSVTVVLSNGVSLPAEVTKLSPPPGFDAAGAPSADTGRDLALLRVRGGDFPALGLSTGESRIGDSVHLLGFPSAVYAHELLDRREAPDASVTNGAVSGFRLDPLGRRLIQTDAPAAYGSSGGPAIGADATVLGVMTFVSLSPSTGAVVQGFNFLIPARDVRAFLAGTDVRIGESPFNAAWTAALAAFFSGDTRAAAPKLARVDAMLRDLADVRRVRAEVQERLDHASPRRVPWSGVALGATLFGAGFCGGLFGHRWRSAPLAAVRWVRRELGIEAVRQRLIERLQAEQEAAFLGGPADMHVAEISRLVVVLARHVPADDSVPSASLPAGYVEDRSERAALPSACCRATDSGRWLRSEPDLSEGLPIAAARARAGSRGVPLDPLVEHLGRVGRVRKDHVCLVGDVPLKHPVDA